MLLLHLRQPQAPVQAPPSLGVSLLMCLVCRALSGTCLCLCPWTHVRHRQQRPKRLLPWQRCPRCPLMRGLQSLQQALQRWRQLRLTTRLAPWGQRRRELQLALKRLSQTWRTRKEARPCRLSSSPSRMRTHMLVLWHDVSCDESQPRDRVGSRGADAAAAVATLLPPAVLLNCWIA